MSFYEKEMDLLRRLLYRSPTKDIQSSMNLCGLLGELKDLTPGHINALDTLKKKIITVARLCFGRKSPYEQEVTNVSKEWKPAIESLKMCIEKMIKELSNDSDAAQRGEFTVIPEIQNLPQSKRQELESLSREALQLFKTGNSKQADAITREMLWIVYSFSRINDASTPSDGSRGNANLNRNLVPVGLDQSPAPSSPVSSSEDLTQRLKREADEFYARGKINQARESYLEYLKRIPGDAEVWNRLGEMSIQAGKKQRAEREFQECLKHNPNNAHAKDRLEQLNRLKERKAST